jgi:hypothetical protein
MSEGIKKEFKNPYEALQFCIYFCDKITLGCANNCELRKKYGIPPFGERYPRKEDYISNV